MRDIFLETFSEENIKTINGGQIFNEDTFLQILKSFYDIHKNEISEFYYNYYQSNPQPIKPNIEYPKESDYTSDSAYKNAVNEYIRQMNDYNEKMKKWDDLFTSQMKEKLNTLNSNMISELGEGLKNILSTALMQGGNVGNSIVFESSDGNIIVEQKEQKQIAINKQMSMKEIADKFNTTIDGWKSMDESIVKIENEKIVALKVGETDLVKVDDNDTFKIHIIVKNEDLVNIVDLVNPETGRNILFVVIIAIISFLSVNFVRKNNIHSKS